MYAKLFGACVLFTATQVAMADCLVPVDKAAMAVRAVEGMTVYIVKKEYVDQLDCLDTRLVDDQAAYIQKLEQSLKQYQTVANELEENLKQYQTVTSDLNSTLANSTSLTDRYDQLVIKYDQLSVDYSALADRYDDLAGKYRSIALDSGGLFSFDTGVGITDDGDFMGLLGVGLKRYRLWGVVQEENTGVVLGVSLPF
ncbi:hypothetical protein [Halioxenophilus sp. WMMB6]|uniref:hypothetical protein n=1 Tax=Halioxenophilus sp. WMMB6 TaxID=3073815 RepID=UPI00295E5CF4|nr:hypothetical protein [Halioxenophilus sp. WMMB6]